MGAPLTVTFTTLQERVGRHLFGRRSGFSTDEAGDIADCIQDGLQSVYTAHSWSFLRPVETVTTQDGKYLYDVPEGYDGIESEFTYEPDESNYYPPVKQVAEVEIRRRRQDREYSDRPLWFAVTAGRFHDSQGSRKQFSFYPTPDDEYRLSAVMRMRPTMIDAEHPYPIGGETLAAVLVEACLAAAERNLDETTGVHSQQFPALLVAAIEADKESSSPMTLGPRATLNPEGSLPGLRAVVESITFNGVEM